MAYRKKTWQEKLEDKEGYPKILILEKGFPCYNTLHKMGVETGDEVVLVNPGEVIDCMKQVPSGHLTTILEICQNLARNHHLKGCCSLTAGIFIMTVANAVEEAKNENRDLGIPYWRTLKPEVYLNEKYPGGAAAQETLLENEGLSVVRRGSDIVLRITRSISSRTLCNSDQVLKISRAWTEDLD